MPRGERQLEAGDSALLRFAEDLRRLRREAGRPSYRELSRRAHYSSTTLSDAAGGRKLPSLDVTLAYVQACAGDLTEWEKRWHAVAAEVAKSSPPARGPAEGGDAAPCPYVGLASFRSEDAGRFFGRERLVGELTARLVRQRLLAVFGASGAGKSSLLQAGLVPAVEAGNVGDRGDWSVLVMTPGSHPLEECAIRLSAMTGGLPGWLNPELKDDRRSLHRLIRQALSGQSPDREMVLVVDQFEEIFTLCQDRGERDKFIAALVTATQVTGSRARVVLGIRADFYARCLDHPDLVEALSGAQVLVGPMTAEELRRAVIRPANEAGYSIEGSLLAVILADAIGQPGGLPLVSHALVETWRRRRGNTLTLAGYRAAGGIQGALAQTAETLYEALPARQQHLAKDLFLRLAALGEGTEDTRRRISRDELDSNDPDTGALLHRLAEARLVTLAENTVDVAHEALIRAWPRLRGWLSADREGLRVHRQLTEAAHAWKSLRRDPGALYRGARLAIAREWVGRGGHRQLAPTEREFLQASIGFESQERAAAIRRGRQLRALTASLAILLVAATAVGLVAVQQRQGAVHAHQVAVSRQLSAQALALAPSQPATAKLLSVEAFHRARTTEARGAVLSMSAHQDFQSEMVAHRRAVSDVAYSPDGRTLATVSRDMTLALWDTQRKRRPATLAGHRTWLRAVAFSSDGRVLATGGDDRKVVLWDVASRTRRTVLTGHTGPVKTIAFSPDGRTMATAGADHTVLLWDTARWVRRGSLTGHTGPITEVSFSPDSRTLATASEDRTAMLWDAARRTRVAVLTGHTQSVDAVAFSPNGLSVATASPDRTVLLWNIAHRTVRARLTGHTDHVRALTFSPDGRTLVSGSHDRTVLLWDTRLHIVRARLTGHNQNIYTVAINPRTSLIASGDEAGRVLLWHPARTSLSLPDDVDWVNDVTFSPDGRTLATAYADTTMLWDPKRRIPTAFVAGHSGLVDAVTFSPGGRSFATAGHDRTVMLWDSATRASLGRLSGHRDRIMDIAFSPDGRTLATASVDRSVKLWDLPRRRLLATLAGHTDVVNGVAFSPDGRTLASASHDQSVILWDLTHRTRQATLTGHTGWVRTVAFSPDGATLASASIDQTVRLWDLAHRTHLATLGGHADAANGVTFSPDGRTVAYTGTGNTAILWDLEQARPLSHLTGHTKPIQALAFTPDGRTLATAGADHAVILWNTDPLQSATDTCEALARNLTPDEWNQFIPELPYRKTCGTA